MDIATRLFGRLVRQPPPELPKPLPVKVNGRAAQTPLLTAPPQQQALREVFTPTTPQRSSRRIAGRQTELLRIFRAIALDRAHVVVYGERGRGKTSLVNLVATAARSAGYMVGRFSCSSGTDFDALVRGLARDLPSSLLAAPAVSDAALEGCEAALPAGRVQPRDVAALPGRLSGRRLVLIADEFDRVEDAAARTALADSIKQVSDRGAALSFVIVGVSDSLEELLGRHPSIQRNILGLPLPLLSDAEIGQILDHARRDAGIEFPSETQQRIVAVARGVPYVAQLLGLHAGVETLARNATQVSAADMTAACQRALDEADPRLASSYETLIQGGRDRAMRNALRAIAGGAQDRFGRFLLAASAGECRVAERRIDPALWQRLAEAGAVRACPSAGPDHYAFAEALFRPYVLLRDTLLHDAAEQAGEAPVIPRRTAAKAAPARASAT